MSNFFDRFKPKDNKKGGASSNGGGGIKWGQLLGQSNAKSGFKGAGEALGGKQPGKVIAVQLDDPGPLGVKVEKRPGSNTAIVAMVVPDSQAARAGLQRGDALCFQGTNGTEEILYEMFLELAKSNQRPLCFEVRRVQTKASAGSSSSSSSSNTGNSSAEAYARKQAMIAAAEKREKAAKQRAKPITKGGGGLNKKDTDATKQVTHDHKEAAVPQTEESRKAALAAKNQEAKLAAQLGYNPYETNKVTAGQARNATTTATHGEINQNTTTDSSSTPSSTAAASAPGAVRPPADPTTSVVEDAETAAALEASRRGAPPPPAFDQAFETAVTSSADHAAVVSSFAILRKLIVNATTKGQNTEDATSAEKFRKVRLSNPKIKAAIVDQEGALDIMMSVGFELTEMEDDGESYLVYPPGGVVIGTQEWLPAALQKLEQYEKS